jgi:hypothetical protein
MMPIKIKLLFVFLAVLAVVSVFSFFDVLGGVRSALIGDAIQPLEEDLTHDADNDGLSDSAESYWNTDFENPDTDGDGFLDGEEVASRHDPTVAGPHDKLADLNLTEKTANIAISGLVEGSLRPGNPNYISSLDSLTLATIDDGLKTFTLYPEDLKIKTIDSSFNNQQIYISAVEPIWEQFFKALGDEINNISKKLDLTGDSYTDPAFISYYIYKRDEFKAITENWQAIPVPKNWQEEHTNFLVLLQQMIKVNDSIVRGAEDPVRAVMGITLLIDLIEQFPEMINIYSEKVKAEKISSKLFN